MAQAQLVNLVRPFRPTVTGIARVEIVQAVVLALIQGLTEFLPVSASGHLLVTSRILGWADAGLRFDVAVLLGSLLAVVAYFWRDVLRMLYGLVSPLLGRAGEESRLAWTVIVATIPLAVAGVLLTEVASSTGGGGLAAVLGDPLVIGGAVIAFAVLLWLADGLGAQVGQLRDMGVAGALFIGLAQVLALIPGTSRTGITITAARLLGYERDEAARFSFLLAIPAIAGAGFVLGRALLEAGGLAPDGMAADALVQDPATQAALIGLVAGFLAGLLAITLLMAWARRGSYLPFVLYRILFGAFLVYWFYDPAGPAIGG